MERIAILALAVAMAVFVTPLFFDLALCIVGNAFRARRARAAVKRVIRLAVVVPAHDEELMIGRTVNSVLSADSSIPVFVVAHNCSDSTASIAAACGAQVVALNDPKQHGKAAALRRGFALAQSAGSNAMLVIDADSIVSPNLIEATRSALEDGADATQCRNELEPAAGMNSTPLARLRMLAFRGMNVLRARGRAGLGFSTGLFGIGFSVTSEALSRVPFLADSITEDVEYHTRLVCSGVRVAWIGEAYVHTHLSAPGSVQAVQEARWEGGRLLVARRATGKLLSAVLRGNWSALETLADVWSLPLSRGILALLLTAALPVHWLHVFAIACGAIALVYVLESALLGPEPIRDIVSLVASPLHLTWKAAITPLVVRQSRSRATWSRTKREAPQP
jgi:glycosyltransferase involved in cell wall biosynthesis